MINKHKLGLVVGSFLGLGHLVWSGLVAVGQAQRLLDLILHLHFLNNPVTVGQFQVSTAVGLVVVTSLIGYVVGWVVAWIWNKVGM